MFTALVLGLIIGVLGIVGTLMPSFVAFNSVVTTLGEMAAGAQAFTVYFPFDTVVTFMLAAIGFEFSLFVAQQALNALNWIRGTGELRLGK